MTIGSQLGGNIMGISVKGKIAYQRMISYRKELEDLNKELEKTKFFQLLKKKKLEDKIYQIEKLVESYSLQFITEDRKAMKEAAIIKASRPGEELINLYNNL